MCVCVHMHAYMHVCVCVHVSAYVYVPMCLCACMYVWFFKIQMIFWVDSAVTLNPSYLRVISPLQLTFFKSMTLYISSAKLLQTNVVNCKGSPRRV